MHYLIFGPEHPVVIHHGRQADGAILTRVLREGVLRLDPPGLEIDIGALVALVPPRPKD